jgi:hypothetical protein
VQRLQGCFGRRQVHGGGPTVRAGTSAKDDLVAGTLWQVDRPIAGICAGEEDGHGHRAGDGGGDRCHGGAAAGALPGSVAQRQSRCRWQSTTEPGRSADEHGAAGHGTHLQQDHAEQRDAVLRCAQPGGGGALHGHQAADDDERDPGAGDPSGRAGGPALAGQSSPGGHPRGQAGGQRRGQ